MSSDQERDHVVDNRILAQRFASLGVLAIDHGIHEILCVGWVFPTLPDEIRAEVAHVRNALLELLVFSAEKRSHYIWPPGLLTANFEEAHHGIDERVHLLLVERVEAVGHGAESESVQSQPCEVVRGRDTVLGAHASPLEDKLGTDVLHVVEHVFHVKRSESRYQDAVGDFPVLLSVVRCEESIVNACTQLVQSSTDRLVEAFLVAHLAEQCY